MAWLLALTFLLEADCKVDLVLALVPDLTPFSVL